MNADKLRELFLSEAEDLMEKLNAGILRWEKNLHDKTILEEIMRASHTFKSSSAAMGYKSMSSLTHALEDIFDGLRKDLCTIAPESVGAVFAAVDALGKSLTAVKTSGQESNLDSMATDLKARIIPVSAASADKNNPKNPPAAPGPTSTPPPTNPSPPGEELGAVSHIKVPVARLDTLLDLTEELLIGKMRLERLAANVTPLKEPVRHLARLIADVQYHVLEARLVPVEQIFIRFPRLVRDGALAQNKKVNLEMQTNGLELDRTIIDKLGEPLVHLLRNALEHGIEKEGTIRLKASRERESAFITVEDDGRGIDIKKIKQRALEKNLASEREISGWGMKEVMDLLFREPFSTKDEVTENAGRGVGLSVVKRFADQVGGHLTVESPISPQGGTRFILELPLTLAIFNALLAEVAGVTVAIPFVSIERSIALHPADIHYMANQEVTVVDAAELPLLRIERLFLDRTAALVEKPARQTAVVVKGVAQRAAIVVDRLLAEQEIIIKPLPTVVKSVRGFAGVSLLGDGETALVLDIKSLLYDMASLFTT